MEKHTPKQIAELVLYNPLQGNFLWKKRGPDRFSDGNKSAAHEAAIWNSRWANKPAFTGVRADGYVAGCIQGKKYLAHRVAWALAYGKWPDGEIDHINHNASDNRIINLRSVSRSENSRNLPRAANNPSGTTGVYWYEQTNRWVAKITHQKRMIHLGYFLKKSDAIAARKVAEFRLGFHENHGSNF